MFCSSQFLSTLFAVRSARPRKKNSAAKNYDVEKKKIAYLARAVMSAFWHFSDMARCLALVCNWAKSGRERQGLNAGRCPLYLSSWPRPLLEDPLHHTCPDAKFPADLEDAVTAGLQFENSRLHGRLYRTPAELGPIRPRASQTGIDPLSNDPPLELGKYANI
jgi:hypothetical protein